MLNVRPRNRLKWFEFPFFEIYPELANIFFSRCGGPEDISLNKDGPEGPEIFRTTLTKTTETLRLRPVVLARQTYSCKIAIIIRPEDPSLNQTPLKASALLSPELEGTLLIKIVNCQAILLYHPWTLTLALVHSDWRRSTKNILNEAIAKVPKLDAGPAEIKTAISSSLGPYCIKFIHPKQKLFSYFRLFMIRKNYSVFWTVNHWQLTKTSLKEKNIAASNVHTRCSAKFFNYNRDNHWIHFDFIAGVQAKIGST